MKPYFCRKVSLQNVRISQGKPVLFNLFLQKYPAFKQMARSWSIRKLRLQSWEESKWWAGDTPPENYRLDTKYGYVRGNLRKLPFAYRMTWAIFSYNPKTGMFQAFWGEFPY